MDLTKMWLEARKKAIQAAIDLAIEKGAMLVSSNGKDVIYIDPKTMNKVEDENL